MEAERGFDLARTLKSLGLATLATTVSMAMAPDNPNVFSENLPTPAAEIAKPLVSKVTEIIPVPLVASAEAKAGGKDDCSSFRHIKNGRYFGLACKSRGDKSIPVGSKQEYKTWSYSFIWIKKDGVGKCGYVRNILSKVKESDIKRSSKNQSLIKGVSYCVKVKNKVRSPTHYLNDHSHGQYKNGKDKGSDGKFVKIKPGCQGLDRRSYGNFTPRGPKKHFLNVFGKKVKKSYSFLRSRNLEVSGVLERFSIRRKGLEKGELTKATMVRTKDVDGKTGWSYFRKKCLWEKDSD